MTVDRLAVVSGTSGAIGGAIAEDLTANGWDVIGVDLRPSAGAVPLVVEVVGDVSQASTWQDVGKRVNDRQNGLQGLVHAAARQVCSPLCETDEADWDQVMAVNVKSVYLAGRELQSMLAAARGAVVGIGSVHARATSADIAAYAASKGAFSALLRAMAVEWAQDGIRVNVVLPGAIDSHMLRDGLMRGHLDAGDVEDRLQQLAARTVMGRVGDPADVSGLVRFLLDPARSSFATGSEFVVDGGALARLSTE